MKDLQKEHLHKDIGIVEVFDWKVEKYRTCVYIDPTAERNSDRETLFTVAEEKEQSNRQYSPVNNTNQMHQHNRIHLKQAWGEGS